MPQWSWSISACAEVPGQWRGPKRDDGVYLRVCGGTPENSTRAMPDLGLSPRVRRYRYPHRYKCPRRRSISACAEVPVPLKPATLTTGVYLRVCGGTYSPSFSSTRTEGLSPRVRRYPWTSSPLALPSRSISACAEVPLRYSVRKGHRSAGKRTACLKKCNRYWACRRAITC